MIQGMGYHKTHTAAGEEFLRGLRYYSEVLIWDSLVKMESELYPTDSRNFTFPGTPPKGGGRSR